MQGVILAAGRGKRLGPLTRGRSKAMLPVLGRPMVGRVMDTLLAAGIRDFVVVVRPDDAEIEVFLDLVREAGATVQTVVQEEPLGAAHALAQAAPFIQEDFVLSSCDNLVPVEHIQALMEHLRGADTTAVLSLMRLSPEQLARSSSVVLRDGLVTHIVEKPPPGEAPSDVGAIMVYAFTPRILDYLSRVGLSPRGEYELPDAIQMLMSWDGGVRGVFLERRLTLTTPEDFLGINLEYLRREEAGRVAPEMIEEDTQIVPPVWIEAGSTIGPQCVIGPLVYVERGARIGRGVTLREAVVLRDGEVPAGAIVVGRVCDGRENDGYGDHCGDGIQDDCGRASAPA